MESLTVKKRLVIFQPGTKLVDIIREVVEETLKQHNQNRTHAAKALGIGIRTLQRKLAKYSAKQS